MKLNNAIMLSEIKKFSNSEALIFLLRLLNKRKTYFLLYLFSGLLDTLFELITVSMIYFILKIITLDSDSFINWQNINFIKDSNYLINFLSSLPFRTIFISAIIFTLLIQILQVFSKYINKISTSYIEAAYLGLITKRINSHIFNSKYIYSSRYKIGDLADYINTSPSIVKTYINGINGLILNCVISFVYVIVLIKVSPWNIPLIFFIFIFSNKLREIITPKISFLSSKVLNRTVDLSKKIIERFQGMRFIFSNGLNQLVLDDINQKIDLLENSLKKTAIKRFLLPTITALSPIIFLALIAIFYSFFSERSDLVSILGVLFISLQRLNTRIISASDSVSGLAQCSPGLNRVIKLFKKEEIKYRKLGGQIISSPFKQITFSKVNFNYSRKAKFSLKDISFSLKTGKITAIVGYSGAGKSSILDLLIGLYEPNSGDIFVDDKNLNDLNINKWQQQISIVNQDTFLLNDSIINNLKFGLENINFHDIKKACIYSGASKFIENLPDSYNTIIGDRGFKLSGGERQRLSIARSFLKRTSLLIFDEATSSLDSINEELIKESISKVSYKKIILIVAHRLSTIKEADNILVLNQGRIVEIGDHKSLLNLNGIYSELWNIQSKS